MSMSYGSRDRTVPNGRASDISADDHDGRHGVDDGNVHRVGRAVTVVLLALDILAIAATLSSSSGDARPSIELGNDIILYDGLADGSMEAKLLDDGSVEVCVNDSLIGEDYGYSWSLVGDDRNVESFKTDDGSLELDSDVLAPGSYELTVCSSCP